MYAVSFFSLTTGHAGTREMLAESRPKLSLLVPDADALLQRVVDDPAVRSCESHATLDCAFACSELDEMRFVPYIRP